MAATSNNLWDSKMPQKHRDPSTITIADMQKNPSAYTAELEDFRQFMILLASDFRKKISDNHNEIRRLLPDFDGSDRSLCKLAGVLSKHYPREPLSDWHDLPVQELLGYIDAIVEQDQSPVPSEGTPPIDCVTPQKKRGRRSNDAADKAIADEYTAGLESGEWDSVSSFAKRKGKNRSTVSKAMTRAEQRESIKRY